MNNSTTIKHPEIEVFFYTGEPEKIEKIFSSDAKYFISNEHGNKFDLCQTMSALEELRTSCKTVKNGGHIASAMLCGESSMIHYIVELANMGIEEIFLVDINANFLTFMEDIINLLRNYDPSYSLQEYEEKYTDTLYKYCTTPWVKDHDSVLSYIDDILSRTKECLGVLYAFSDTKRLADVSKALSDVKISLCHINLFDVQQCTQLAQNLARKNCQLSLANFSNIFDYYEFYRIFRHPDEDAYAFAGKSAVYSISLFPYAEKSLIRVSHITKFLSPANITYHATVSSLQKYIDSHLQSHYKFLVCAQYTDYSATSGITLNKIKSDDYYERANHLDTLMIEMYIMIFHSNIIPTLKEIAILEQRLQSYLHIQHQSEKFQEINGTYTYTYVYVYELLLDCKKLWSIHPNEQTIPTTELSIAFKCQPILEHEMIPYSENSETLSIQEDNPPSDTEISLSIDKSIADTTLPQSSNNVVVPMHIYNQHC